MNDLAEVTILRTNGTSETHEVGRHILLDWIQRMIGCRCTDVVNLRDGRVMLVDDNGYESTPVDRGNGVTELVCTKALKPVNVAATKLYHSVCIPGTTHEIVGDVAITLDENFA